MQRQAGNWNKQTYTKTAQCEHQHICYFGKAARVELRRFAKLDVDTTYLTLQQTQMDPKCPEFRPNFQPNVSTSAKPLIKPVVRSANKPGFEVRELAMYLKHPMNIQICGRGHSFYSIFRRRNWPGTANGLTDYSKSRWWTDVVQVSIRSSTILLPNPELRCKTGHRVHVRYWTWNPMMLPMESSNFW